MAKNTQWVYLQWEKDNEKRTNWRRAQLTFDEMDGSIHVNTKGLGASMDTRLHPEQMASLDIEMISDTGTLATMYGGGLIGFGVATLMGRWIKLPTIVLTNPNAPAGERKFIIRGIGLRQRKVTKEIAQKIDRFFGERGFSGERLDLAREEYWKAPVVPTLVGCGLVIALVVAIFACIAIVGASS